MPFFCAYIFGFLLGEDFARTASGKKTHKKFAEYFKFSGLNLIFETSDFQVFGKLVYHRSHCGTKIVRTTTNDFTTGFTSTRQLRIGLYRPKLSTTA